MAIAGKFMEGLLGAGKSITQAMSVHSPQQVGVMLASAIPAIAAMQLLDLSQTGEVLGTYLKNKLVPGLEEANVARQMELDAKLEMGAKQLPQLSAASLGFENDRLRKQQLVEEALMKKDELMNQVKTDEFLTGIPEDRIQRLVDDVIRLAPMVTMDNPSVVLSVIRSAALTGADSIDVATANQLAMLEKSYSGVRS